MAEAKAKACAETVCITIPLSGEMCCQTKAELAQGLKALEAVDKIALAKGAAILKLKKEFKAIKLSEIEAAVKSANLEIAADDLKISGRVTLTVKGMVCKIMCGQKLARATKKIEGLSELRVEDAKAGTVTATLDKASYGELANAVREAGYALADITWRADR
ncbi:MAG: hypothetical protein HY716_13800 [Planctomycetes bacterium]|nr:hypothetical protein [Planctomycetota bacterium]